MKSALFHFTVAVALTTTLPAVDVEEFFDSHFIIDGVSSYYVIDASSGSEAAPFPGEGSDPDFSGIKAATGCNAAPMTVSTLRSLTSQVSRIESGEFKNARVVRTFSDLIECRKDGAYGILFYKQSPWPMPNGIDAISEWKEAGLRVFQLAYGSSKPAPRGEELGFGCDEEGGLTDLGRSAVLELNRLHLLIDVSHCNEETTLDACRLSKHPVVATHANADAVSPHDRNKSDAEIRAIASSGGVIGVTTVGWMIEHSRTKQRGVEEFVDHIDYIRKLVGIEHVAVSSDAWFNGWPVESPHFACEELASPHRWKHVAAELLERGYSESELEKIFSHNWLRVLRLVLDP